MEKHEESIKVTMEREGISREECISRLESGLFYVCSSCGINYHECGCFI